MVNSVKLFNDSAGASVASIFSTNNNDKQADSHLSSLCVDLFQQAHTMGRQFLCDASTYFAVQTFQSGLANPAIAKLATGTLGVANGVYCLVKSQVPASLYRFLRNERRSEPAIDSSIIMTTNKIKKGACFAFGALSLTYGLYNLYLGACEIYYGQEKAVLFDDNSGPCIYYPADSEIVEEEESSADALYEAWSKIIECPASNQFVKKLEEAGEFNFVQVPADQAPHFNYKGSWSPVKRTFFIREQLGKDTLSVALFELLNAVKSQDLIELLEKGRQGDLSREVYVKTMERIEHDNRKIYSDIYQACAKSRQWPADRGQFKGLLGDFEELWDTRIKISTHSEWFRKDWRDLFYGVYCDKHPEASECQLTFNAKRKK